MNLKNPDFVAVTKGFHVEAMKVEKYSALSKALDQMLSAKKAFVLEVVVEKEENVFPMVPAGASVAEVVLE